MATRKPRIRKTAPTLRERVEIERQKSLEPKRESRIKKTATKAAAPVKKIRLPKLPENKFTRILKRIVRIITPTYFINAWREVRQVTWPTRRETWRLTGAVFIFAIVFGSLVAGVDKILDILFKNLVLK